MEHRHTGPAHGAAADDQGLDAGGSAQAVDEFSLSPVDGQQGVQTHQRPQLAGRLTVGGAVPVGVLGGKRDALAVQQRLHLLGMGGGVDAGEHNLVLPQQGEFTGLQLLHLGDKIAGPIDLLHGVHQLGALLGVLLVRKAGARARAPLHIDLMAVAHNGLHFRGSHDGAVLAGFNILQQSKFHRESLHCSPNFIGNPSIVLRRSLLHKLISPTRQLRLSVSHGVQISCQLQTSHFLRPGEAWVCNPSKIPPGRRKAPIIEPYKSPIMGACSILVILGRSRPRSVRKTQAPRFHPGRQSV